MIQTQAQMGEQYWHTPWGSRFQRRKLDWVDSDSI